MEAEEQLVANIDWDRAAPWYDACVRADFDLAFWRRLAACAGGPVLELMCGTGRITLPLLEDGCDVTGVDSSRGLLQLLQRKLDERGRRTSLHQQDVRRLALNGTWPLVFVGFHAFAEVLGKHDRLKALRAIRRCVAPGGRLVVALHNPSVRIARVHSDWRSHGIFSLPDSGTVEMLSRWAVASGGTRIEGAQRYVAHDAKGQTIGEVALPIAFDLVTLEEMQHLSDQAGLRVETTFGDYDERPFVADSPFMILSMA